MVDWSALKQRYGLFIAIAFIILVLVVAVVPTAFISAGSTSLVAQKTLSVSVAHSPASPAEKQIITFSATASCNVKITLIRIYVDGKMAEACKIYSNYGTCAYSTNSLAAGSHTYYASATNIARTTVRSSVKSFTVAKAAGENFILTVSKSGSGAGTITSSPAGINCGTDCTENYVSGTSVTLTATAGTGSTFSGWSGACTGTGTCIVTMNAAKTVNAAFALYPNTEIMDLQTLNPNFKGYARPVFANGYVYFVPYNSASPHGNVLRYNTSYPFTINQSGSWWAIDLKSTFGSYFANYDGTVYLYPKTYPYLIFVPKSYATTNVISHDVLGNFTHNKSNSWAANTRGKTPNPPDPADINYANLAGPDWYGYKYYVVNPGVDGKVARYK